MNESLQVLVGSALGGLARYWMGLGAAALLGPRLPWGTLAINVLGSFVIGLYGAATAADGRFAGAFWARPLVMVGLCGGFTTFSSFSLQTVELLHAGELGWAAAYVLGSVALCLLATWAGIVLGQM